MIREALVVGINRYPFLKDATGKSLPLLKAAEDAEAVAQILETYGNFRVRRLPEIYLGDARRVDNKQLPPNLPGVKQLEKEISELFNPPSENPPDTALLFFAGHGFPKDPDGLSEGFLATCDVNIENDKFGVSFNWLRDVLDKSPVRQQIVILDCCHSGEFINLFKVDSAKYKKAEQKYTSRCFIAASRDFEAAFEQIEGDHGLLTSVLLEKLNPENESDGWVDNYRLVDFINKQLAKFPQQPVFYNAGGEIILTGQKQLIDKKILEKQICPYKGLESFELKDAQYFYGREELTEELLNKVWSGNFLAVVGASGSGKSSVVKAGLLYEIEQGLKRSGTKNWQILIFRPDQHPFESLARVFKTTELTGELQLKGEELRQRGVDGFVQYVRAIAGSERLILLVDQFEECFTLCNDLTEREDFFKCLFEGLERLQNNLCIVITMRSDFVGKCMEREYSGLAQKIKDNLVPVLPMKPEELQEAITKPAEKVGSEVMSNLVEQMLNDVEGPGSLPLLQFTLRQLWDLREFNRLTLAEYKKLRGVKGALENKANETYNSLSESEKNTAKRIFLELTHLGEGTEDTRRQVLKSNLITEPDSEEVVNNVLDKLTKAGLLVTSEVKRGEENSEPVIVVDVAHEALIRNWTLLRGWVEKNRENLMKKRKIDNAASDWFNSGKSKDDLLQGLKLSEAEIFLEEGSFISLTDQGIEFVKSSQAERNRRWAEEEERQQQEVKNKRKRLLISCAVAGSVFVAVLGTVMGFLLYKIRQDQIRQIDILSANAELGLGSNLKFDDLKALTNSLKAVKQVNQAILVNPEQEKKAENTLQNVVYAVRERNRLEGHTHWVTTVVFKPDGMGLVSGGKDGTIRLWDLNGKQIHQVKASPQPIKSISISNDGKRLVSVGEDGIVRLWELEGDSLRKFYEFKTLEVLTSVSFSPDGKKIVTGGGGTNIRLWDLRGNKIDELSGHKNRIVSLSFSKDGTKLASTDRRGIFRLWNLNIANNTGNKDDNFKKVKNANKNRFFVEQKADSTGLWDIVFSEDGKQLATAGNDGTVGLWDEKGNNKGKFKAYNMGEVNSVAFSPDGKQLATAGRDGTIRLWDVKNKDLLQEFKGHFGQALKVIFSPDGKQLVSSGEDFTIRLWDLQEKELALLRGHGKRVNSVIFTSNGKQILTASYDGSVRLWDLKGKQLDLFKQNKKRLNSVSYNEKTNQLATVGEDGIVRLWDLEGKLLTKFPGLSKELTMVSFAPNGNQLATAGADGTVKLWNLQGINLGKFVGHNGTVWSVTFSSDGKQLASSGKDGTVRLWDVETKQQLKLYEGHIGDVWSVNFDRNGKQLVSGGNDNTVRVWDKDTKEQLKELKKDLELKNNLEVVASVSFSADGRYLATGGSDNIVRLWDTQTYKQVGQFKGHTKRLSSVSFSPDSKLLASASEDGTAMLWQIENLDELVERGCNWLHDYLENNPKVKPADRHLCDGVKPSK